jgi:hypothetical protein
LVSEKEEWAAAEAEASAVAGNGDGSDRKDRADRPIIVSALIAGRSCLTGRARPVFIQSALIAVQS